MPDRRLISSGSDFERESAYSRAVVDGDWIHVAGTTGFDYEQMTIPEGVVDQTEQAFRNIIAALAEADATLADVVRVRYIVPDPSDFRRRGPCCAGTSGTCVRRPRCSHAGWPTRG